MLILGIESTCDECSISVVKDGHTILSCVTASQIKAHEFFNGVVPEIASRLHTQWIDTVFKKALAEAAVSFDDIDGIAVASFPGLIGSLSVGLNFAKGLSVLSGKPFIVVDHLKAHIYANHLHFQKEGLKDLVRDSWENPKKNPEKNPEKNSAPSYPYIGLLASGGHTIITIVHDPLHWEVKGSTIDDACGEVFDKIAHFFNLGFPGGKLVDSLAQKGNPLSYRFPKAKIKNNPYHFSYSGLKTAVLYQNPQFLIEGQEESLENILASFQKTAIDMLFDRASLLSKETGLTTLVIGGGVASNSYLRQLLAQWDGYIPPLSLCTDNGAMIAGLGYHFLKNGITSPMDIEVFPKTIQKAVFA